MISQDNPAGRYSGMNAFQEVTLRLSTPEDAIALGRLARLDSTLYDGSQVLIAQVGEDLVAAVPLDGGPAFADPFRHSAELVALLGLRLHQLAAADRRAAGLSRAPRAVRRPRRYRAPASA